MNTAKQSGGVLGLAVLVAVSSVDLRTPEALAEGYGRAFVVIAAVLVAAAAAALALPAKQNPVAGNGRV